MAKKDKQKKEYQHLENADIPGFDATKLKYTLLDETGESVKIYLHKSEKFWIFIHPCKCFMYVTSLVDYIGTAEALDAFSKTLHSAE